MAPLPSPSPALHPVFNKANTAWKFSANVMGWFSKLVTTAYTWTDLIVKNRQKKVDNAYNIKKAEEKAAEIMKNQQGKEKRTLAKRSADFVGEEGIWGGEEGFDKGEFEEFLQTLSEE
jgi:hypothetical protein